jgi:hypothetical protein
VKALAMLRAALAALALLVGGCSLDIFDVQANLDTQTFRYDFGSTQGTVPVVACSPGAPGSCDLSSPEISSAIAGIPGAVTLSLACDGGTSRCYGEAEARVALTFAVLQDDDLTTRIERRAASLVHGATLAYTVPVNTLTIAVPQIDIYTGPEGTAHETDPGVVAVGSIPPLAAATPVTVEQQLQVSGDSPARKSIADAVGDRRAFVLLLALTPRLDGGAPIPAGAIEIDVQPRLLLGP